METKKMARFLGALRKCGTVFLLSVAAFGCSDDEEDKKKEEAGVSEVTLNGGPYANVTAKTTTTPATAAYSPQDGMTAITYTAFAGDDEFLVVIAFPGNDPGQETWDGENCFASTMQIMDDNEHTVMASYLEDGNTLHAGHVKIDSYGQVGGIISGSFEGDVTFIDTECGCVNKGTMKGIFRAQRLQ